MPGTEELVVQHRRQRRRQKLGHVTERRNGAIMLKGGESQGLRTDGGK